MTFRFVIVFCTLAAAGCALETPIPTEAPVAVAAVAPERAPTAAALPADAPNAAVAEPPNTAPTPPASPEATTTPAVAPAPEIVARPLSNPAANSAAPSSPTVAPTPTAPAVRPPVAAPSSPPAPVTAQTAAPTLDFTSLGARLRTTKAIGVLTKLSVKNQADDLLAQFRDYHTRRGAATLPDLRLSYDMLVFKLLSLVQDADPPLATDINRSRTAIWDILCDQKKFIDANLMAGASL
jgi:hypothetical protein